MAEKRPDYLKQGEIARLFPVLSNSSKEGRTTSIVLACLAKIEEFGAGLLETAGQRVGKRATIEAYTEVSFKKQSQNIGDRPDGLIVLKVGSRVWRALVEAKVGSNSLDPLQIEKYRVLAKENDIQCVITISNQFATSPSVHPLEEVRKSRSNIPVFHWSWMHVLTSADLLIRQKNVADVDQLVLLNELRRFLSHESAGVKGFDRMPKEWSDLNKLVSSGGIIPAKSPEAIAVIDAWRQETRDLSFILSRMLELDVVQKLPRSHVSDNAVRQRHELELLKSKCQLTSVLVVPDAAANLEITVDLKRRCIEVGMLLRAPEDKKSTKARLNWLLRQIGEEVKDDLYVRLLWPGKSEPTQFSVVDLRRDANVVNDGKDHLTSHGFFVFSSVRTAGRFAQQSNFISDLEEIVASFYGSIGSNLSAWVRTAPKIKPEKSAVKNVSPEAMSGEAEKFHADRN